MDHKSVALFTWIELAGVTVEMMRNFWRSSGTSIFESLNYKEFNCCAQRQIDRHQVFALSYATTQGLEINTSCIQINFNNNEKHLSEAENMKNVHYTTMTSEIFEESWIYIVVTVNRKFFLRSEEKIEWNASIELCHEFVKRQKAALTSHGDFFAPERIL